MPERRSSFRLMIKKVLVGFLATVGAISIVGLAGYVVLRKLAPALDPPTSHSFTSPKGQYRAVLLTDAGGGGISPYCQNKVLVIPTSLNEHQAALTPNRHRSGEGKYEVYSAPCDLFQDHNNSPKLEWTADDALEITFSINSTALFTHEVRLRKLDDSKQVNVRYIVEYAPIRGR